MTDARAKAEKVIALFEARSGFDWWWDDIDPEDQEDIITELAELLEAE